MKIWSWTVDDWNAAFEVLTILFVAGTVLTGTGKLYTDKIIKERHAQDLAEQQKQTAKAKSDLAEVQEKLRRRTLTKDERNNLVRLLRSYVSHANEAKEKGELLAISHPVGDGEATEFANLLGRLFFQAGWTIQIQDAVYPDHFAGMVIVVSDSINPPLYAQFLQRVLSEMKLPVPVREEKGIDGKWTFLEVGSLY